MYSMHTMIIPMIMIAERCGCAISSAAITPNTMNGFSRPTVKCRIFL